MARSMINNQIIRGSFCSVWLNNEKLAEATKVEAKVSINTEELIARDLGVDWENAYHNREAINTAWTEIVTTK